MDIQKKLDQLSKHELKQVILWTLRDLNSAGQNKQLNNYVRGWCRMLFEAVEYQVDKAIKSNIRGFNQAVIERKAELEEE
jgi:uncharacterized membrane-anchored protein YjiN (DUF445 family)